MTTKQVFLLSLIAAVGMGCGVDRNSAEYDERRYTELQKSRCQEMASLLAKPLLTEEPQNYDDVVVRCRTMKTLSFEEYKQLADHGRATGAWDVFEVFPEKQPAVQNEE